MDVRRSNDGHIIIGTLKIRSLAEVPGSVRALKKPIAIAAYKIIEPFQVQTTEGLMKGKMGDWLMEGVSGELYICPAEIFTKSYDILER
jgi:hypothetical protein